MALDLSKRRFLISNLVMALLVMALLVMARLVMARLVLARSEGRMTTSTRPHFPASKRMLETDKGCAIRFDFREQGNADGFGLA